jgi:hypothetical protein
VEDKMPGKVVKGLTELGEAVRKRGRKRKPRGRKAATEAQKKAAKVLGISVNEAKKLPDEKIKEALRKKRKAPPKVKRTKKEEKELARLTKEQEEDIKAQEQGLISPYGRERRRELYPSKGAYRESNPLERKVGVGSGPEVGMEIMRGKALTKQEMDELREHGYIDVDNKRYGGKIKRRMGGMITKGYGKAKRGY